MNDKCKWVINESPDETIYYETSCNNAFTFIEDGIEDNNYKFCPYCGKEIEEVKE